VTRKILKKNNNDVLSPFRERDRERVENKDRNISTKFDASYLALIILLNLDFLRSAVFL